MNVGGKDGKNYKNNKHFNNAIKKYGWNNINHEILLTGLTKKQAEDIEIYLISKYKSNNCKYGYNVENRWKFNRKIKRSNKEKN